MNYKAPYRGSPYYSRSVKPLGSLKFGIGHVRQITYMRAKLNAGTFEDLLVSKP